MKTRILALDTGTKTGWCIGSTSGVQVFDLKRGESVGMRFLRFRAWLTEIVCLAGGVAVICYEQAHHRGGHATQVAVGFITEILTFSALHKIETMPVHSGTLKKFATGSGVAKKPDMITAARAHGYAPTDDNEADACLLYEYAVAELYPTKRTLEKEIKHGNHS